MRILSKKEYYWDDLDKEQDLKKVLKKCLDLLMGGKIPKCEDERGHDKSVRFNITPAFNRVICGTYELAPSGLYKSKSEFLRALMAMGCYLAQVFFRGSISKDDVKEVKELQEVLLKYDTLCKEEEINLIKEEYRKLKDRKLKKGDVEGVKDIKKVEKDHINLIINSVSEDIEFEDV